MLIGVPTDPGEWKQLEQHFWHMTSELWFCGEVRQATFVLDGSEMVALGDLHVVDEQLAVALTPLRATIEEIMKNFNGMRRWRRSGQLEIRVANIRN